MRTFVQKRNQPQERISSGIARSNRATSKPIHNTHLIVQLQRTIGNQAVQRLLRTDAKELEVGPTSTATTRFANDLSQIQVHAKTPPKMQTKLMVNTPSEVYKDDNFEREAEQAAERVTDNYATFPIIAPLAPLAPSATVVQRNGIGSAARFRDPYAQYQRFIQNAERYGLPVAFLRRVGRDYTIVASSDEDQVNEFFNTLELSNETLSSVINMTPALPLGESTGIQTIYHESTHAYLDLLSGDPRFRTFSSAGEQHYQGAPLRGRRTTSDASRVFKEAAASYVGHRAATWWSAFEMLSIYVSSGRLTVANLDSIRRTYNRQVAERVFGYSEEGGWFGTPIGAEQIETTRPMTNQMKQFLDHELLEDRIPDDFNAIVSFQRLIATTPIR